MDVYTYLSQHPTEVNTNVEYRDFKLHNKNAIKSLERKCIEEGVDISTIYEDGDLIKYPVEIEYKGLIHLWVYPDIDMVIDDAKFSSKKLMSMLDDPILNLLTLYGNIVG